MAKSQVHKRLRSYRKQLEKLSMSGAQTCELVELQRQINDTEFELMEAMFCSRTRGDLTSVSKCNARAKKLKKWYQKFKEFTPLSEKAGKAKAQILEAISSELSDVQHQIEAISNRDKIIARQKSKQLAAKQEETEKIHRLSGFYKPPNFVSGGSPGLGKKR
ncbi:hypothetical protein [Kordiimonas lacus]|uniref:Uncharacterized protein n=1 Tax=Kordiimonas lacus TaxID=637679 RepID=A0A1G7BK88_9PROT|nr:hypothetical protein [Kordiimonas lacus]SDE27357.1 hypothetical protein SAMN04488071_2550 [Kordiimonas lacus]